MPAVWLKASLLCWLIRHNMIYWRSEDWIGIGPGAHGRLTTHHGQRRHAFAQIKLPTKWMDAVEKYGHGVHEMKVVIPTERLEVSRPPPPPFSCNMFSCVTLRLTRSCRRCRKHC
jgi:hypothetical protein